MESEGPSEASPAVRRQEATESGAEEGRRPAARVGYLGPRGTFSEEALLAGVVPDSVAPVPQASIYDTVVALREGDLEGAIVPIENSLDGSINVTLDLLADEAGGVRIVGETRLTVRHSLIAACALELDEIDTVLTHPQVPGQCLRFLRGELARARVLPASSTAEAVREVVDDARPHRAALGTRLAAEIYGGTVLREGVQDRDDNETRFVWLARPGGGSPVPVPAHAVLSDEDGDESRRRKTSLVFWGPGAERPGWLVRCLDEFARREINLTRIESRPRREGLGHYMFFVDLEGAVEAEQSVNDALVGVRGMCEEVRVLGSYPPAP
ncbi:MAG: prephenate dehydratase [Solirubrobacteraceae bacterium]